MCNSSHPGIATILNKTNRKIFFFKYKYFFTNKYLKKSGEIKIFGLIPLKYFIYSLHALVQYPFLVPWYIITLILFFYRNDFDRLVIVNGGYPASLICRCASIAWRIRGKRPHATFNFHSLTQKYPLIFWIPEYFLDKLVIKSTANFVSVSKICIDSLMYRKAFSKCKNLLFIHNGIEDPTLKLNNTFHDSKNQKSNHDYCLMLATYQKYKGHLFLLEAFKYVVEDYPNLLLYIYGHGQVEEKESIIRGIKRLALENNVILNDFINETAIIISNAKVMIVPSQAYESFGLTIIEAMALSTPVVATDVGGLSEVMAESNAGYVCSKDDTKAFADAILRILSNPDLAKELGHNGRLIYEKKFTASIMARKYETLIKK